MGHDSHFDANAATPPRDALVDIQAQGDTRGIALSRVGVRGLRAPIVVLDQTDGRQQTVAELSMSVDLPPEVKGTHMSRFVEVLDAHRGEFTMRTLPALCADLRTRLGSNHAAVTARFPYFVEREAPASWAKSLMDLDCTFTGEVLGEVSTFTMTVEVPVTSLCPCSKAISDYGAHNQRGILTISVRGTLDDSGALNLIWIEDLLAVAERSASAPVYPLLKREDERFVTMQAYYNPVFVEDLVRNIADKLKILPELTWFQVEAENFESIHLHNAYAMLSSLDLDA